MSWKICWRNLMRKKLRTFFTIIAMIASVAIVLAVFSSVDSTKKLIEKQMQESEGNATYVLESKNNAMSSVYLSKVRQVKA
ncbi:ABC transporter permease, partial [Aneurinibacillus aneurinilyticus]